LRRRVGQAAAPTACCCCCCALCFLLMLLLLLLLLLLWALLSLSLLLLLHSAVHAWCRWGCYTTPCKHSAAALWGAPAAAQSRPLAAGLPIVARVEVPADVDAATGHAAIWRATARPC
jgi:hypothetical protein